MFLTNKGRLENMGTHKEKRTQKHCFSQPRARGSVDCTFQCYSKEKIDRHVNRKHMII